MSHEILVVDDEADIRALITGILQDEGYATRQASNGPEAIDLIDQRCPHLIILDIWLGDSSFDGIKILDLVRKNHPEIPIIMISGHGTIETAVAAIRKGAYDFIEKPFKAEKLLILAKRALENLVLKRDVNELRGLIMNNHVLIGSSSALNQIRHSITKLAAVESRVLITGPQGSGKELCARLLHQQSQRSTGPCIVFRCSNKDPELFEQELFGVENYLENRPLIGALEKAHGGVLILDEITSIPPLAQAKLIKFFHEKSFCRVKGSRPVDADVRIISISMFDVACENSFATIREDLMYRLKVAQLNIPPLRDRCEDIPSLMDYYLKRRALTLGVIHKSIREDAMTALKKYDWPGNVRQLMNVVDWIYATHLDTSRDIVTLEDLPREIAEEIPPVLGLESVQDVLSLPLREARELFEREYVISQLAKHSGNVSQTAQFIGMERSALHRKLKALSIHVSEKSEDFEKTKMA